MFTIEQVSQLAPDAASLKAGRELARPAKWQQTGMQAPLAWGSIQGSGKEPYRTVVDASAPAFHCSCPSRKLPCKHSLGLMFLIAETGVAVAAELPDWVREWRDERSADTTTAEPPAELARLLLACAVEDPNGWVLREAAQLLVRRGEHLPHPQLPIWFDLLLQASPKLREPVFACSGARGAQLLRLDPAWQVLLPSPPESSHWERGDPDQRIAWLRARRAQDPAAARAALLTVWTDEPPEMREPLLACLSTGLGPDDEALLETACTDEREEVRRAALRLLAALPGSAYAQRMRARIDAWLAPQSDTGAGLEVRLPETYDEAWALDGIPEKTTRRYLGIGDKANWLVEALSALPPRALFERWKLDPDSWHKRIEQHEYATALWTGMALAFERSPDATLVPLMATNRVPALQMHLLQACALRVQVARDFDAWLRPWVEHRAFEPATLLHLLPALDTERSQFFLDALRRMIEAHCRDLAEGRFHYDHIWSQTLPRFSERVHPDVLPAWRAVLEPLSADPLTGPAVASARDIAARRAALQAFLPSAPARRSA